MQKPKDKQKFRAFLLAAGLGTRLRPLTNHKPKCLVRIGDDALLGHWLIKLEEAGCEEVLINTHHLSTQVHDYINNWKQSSMTIKLVYEQRLLGTAGSLLKNQKFFRNQTGLLIHADNYMEDRLDNFLKANRQRSEECILTMLTFHTNNPKECGIVEVDKWNRMIGFHEKVNKPPGYLANGALYAFDAKLLEFMNSMKVPPSDFSNDVLPQLVNKVQTWQTNLNYIDIVTHARLEKARQSWKNIK